VNNYIDFICNDYNFQHLFICSTLLHYHKNDLNILFFIVPVPIDGIHVCLHYQKAGRKVIPDFRPPHVIRIAPVALYTGFHDVWQVASHLKEIMDSGEYKRFSKSRKVVS